MAEGAKRECEEEALITPTMQSLIAVVDVVHAEQVHVFYRATIDDDNFGAGEESLDVKLYKLNEIPWELIAFETVKIALTAQIEKDANDETPVYQTIQ
jgi:ADP-ribose pyrophosphatase YjhB (NUDIX family)